MHEIFRRIVTLDDLEHGINSLLGEGKLPETEREKIVEMVRRALENPVVSQWFSHEAKIMTEAEILLPNGAIIRPDRMVFINKQVQIIDYKFGETQSEKYRQQMRYYADQLRKMGYASVHGFLWYVTLNKVEEVRERSLRELFEN